MLSTGTIPQNDRLSPAATAQVIATSYGGKLPASFPTDLWNDQMARYLTYRDWYDGTVLAESQTTQNGKAKIAKYPLKINPVRSFTRKHAAVLLGQDSPEGTNTLIRPRVVPIAPVDGDEQFSEAQKKLAYGTQAVLDEIWEQSHGRAIQTENANTMQYMGGCIFRVEWVYERRSEFRIPILVTPVQPDLFLPIWRPDSPWWLLEAYYVYRLPRAVAEREFNIPMVGGTSVGYVTYCEHWTRKNYSIYIDGVPLTLTNGDGVSITYDDLDNEFGFVPFVYIPRGREGNSLFGPSLVEDVSGLALEYNARLADLGDAIRETVHRKRYVRGLARDVALKQLADGIWAINLGSGSPASKTEPHAWVEDPPALSDAQTNFPKDVLWNEMKREGSLSDVAFGEGDTSQRSALTYSFLMWPTTSTAAMMRTFWTEGLNTIDWMILLMMAKKRPVIKAFSVPDDIRLQIRITQRWLPMLPRDREALINEVVALGGAALMSPQRALSKLGDVEYVEEEIANIKLWQEFLATVKKPADPAVTAPKSVMSQDLSNTIKD